MVRLIASLTFVILLAVPAWAQEDDKGWLTNLLQDSLAGEGRVVNITGFAGALSSEATVESITIAGDEGIWLDMQGLTLQWNRSALLRGRIEIERLAADTILLARLPVPADTGLPDPEASGFSLPELPVSIEINAVEASEITLGAPLLGEEIRLTLDAALSLIDGAADIELKANRVDGKDGRFDIDAAFDGSTEQIALNIDLSEGADGLAARLIGIPDRPALDLNVAGTGNLNDLTTDIRLASDGQDRLSGTVRLLAETAAASQTAVPTRRFEADLGGDVTALFAPQYRDFFGPEISLLVAGTRTPDGALELADLSLTARALSLNGAVSLNEDFWPTRIDMDGALASDAPVLLPMPGVETRIQRADLSIRYDRTASNRWAGLVRLQGLDRPEVQLDDLRLTAGGELDGEVGTLGRVTANLDLFTEGLLLADTGLAEAVGPDVTGTLRIEYTEDAPVEITEIDLAANAARLTGEATIDALDTGFQTDLEIMLTAEDIARFSTLAGRDLAGRANIAVDGQVALGGVFDLEVDGTAQNLLIGQAQADLLLRGQTELSIAARRNLDGTILERADIQNDQMSLEASGRFATGASDATFDLSLNDLAELEPRLPGPLTVRGTATEDGRGWSVDLEANGPLNSSASFEGLATGPDARLAFTFALPDIRPIAPPYTGPLALDGVVAQSAEGWRVETEVAGPYGLTADLNGRVTGANPSVTYAVRLPDIRPFVPQVGGALALDGTARQESETQWQIDSALRGPAGTTADIGGTVSTTGQVNLGVVGSAPLALSEPFLRPRSLLGDARFDLRIDGPPGLEAVSGTISTSNARFAAPNFALALTDIRANVGLQRGRATVDLDAAVSSGGRVSVRGPVGLTGARDAALTVTLNAVRLVDPTLYETQLNGAIALRGPLSGGATIDGRIDVGETEVLVPSTGVSGFGIVPEIAHVGASSAVRATQARAGISAQPSAAISGDGSVFRLNVLINAPGRIFVRGRGLDTELGGRVRLTGTTANVITAGRFDLIRGRLDVLEKRFQLDEGNVQLQGDFDPFLRFVATTPTSNGSASVVIEGRASSPEVRFESVPDAPQDEILAQIFFRRDVSQLSAFQALQLANAVATLAGRGGEGIVSRLRRTFNFDDLDVTTDDDGNTALRVGKYLSDNIYTDVTTGTNGTAEISLNVDLTPSITARGSVRQDGNSSLGVFFERDY